MSNIVAIAIQAHVIWYVGSFGAVCIDHMATWWYGKRYSCVTQNDGLWQCAYFHVRNLVICCRTPTIYNCGQMVDILFVCPQLSCSHSVSSLCSLSLFFSFQINFTEIVRGISLYWYEVNEKLQRHSQTKVERAEFRHTATDNIRNVCRRQILYTGNDQHRTSSGTIEEDRNGRE